VNATEKARISQAAQLSDKMPAPTHQEGYVAERHQSLPDLIVVWASCGCYAAFGDRYSVVTECGREGCDFQWAEAESALLALELAEKELVCATDVKGPVLVKPAPEAIKAPESGTSTSEPASSLTNSSTTASVPSEGPNPAAAGIATRTAIDQLIDAMISEGGPVDVPPNGALPEET
jgi:hypothetical protein